MRHVPASFLPHIRESLPYRLTGQWSVADGPFKRGPTVTQHGDAHLVVKLPNDFLVRQETLSVRGLKWSFATCPQGVRE